MILGSLLSVSPLFAETAEDHSHFEVASIRPVDHNVRLSYTGPETGDPGRIMWSRVSLRELISGAYPQYREYGIRISGPSWIDDDYSVTAKVPPGATKNDVDQMLQNLVIERFGLKFHDQISQVQGFELQIGESGFKLTPSTAEVASSPPPGSGAPLTPSPSKLDAQGFPILAGGDFWRSVADRDLGVLRVSFRQCSMNALADMLSGTYTRRTIPVIDKTEIKGLFDFHLLLAAPSHAPLPPRLAAQIPPQSDPEDPAVDLREISGSLEKQTGLRLKAVKVTVRTMVIDSLTRTPTEN